MKWKTITFLCLLYGMALAENTASLFEQRVHPRLFFLRKNCLRYEND